MESRNIKFEFLDVGDYFIDEMSKEVSKKAVLEEIRKIRPQMIFLVICFSQILEFKYLLEETGLFAEMRINRDLKLLSKGKILTMSKTQREFIETLAKPENITKPLVYIEGQVGSGKTLLGIEALRMKIAYYLRHYGLTAQEGQKYLRVIVILEQGESSLLKSQLEKEFSEDVGTHSNFKIFNEALKVGALEKLVKDHSDYDKFKHTLVLIDECNFTFSHAYTINQMVDCPIDYIHCNRYQDNGKKFDKIIEEVLVYEDMISVQLQKVQRSSQEIMMFSNYYDWHYGSSDSIPQFSVNVSLCGKTPRWMVFSSRVDFLEFLKTCVVELFQGKDTMIIYEDESESDDISEVVKESKIKVVARSEVRGAEADVVFVHDFEYCEYEIFTRARHELFIITYSNTKYGT